MYGVKGKLPRTYFGEMGSFFFGFCNTIFCRNLQFFHKEIQELVNFQRNVKKNNRPSVSFYKDYWYQMTT